MMINSRLNSIHARYDTIGLIHDRIGYECKKLFHKYIIGMRYLPIGERSAEFLKINLQTFMNELFK